MVPVFGRRGPDGDLTLAKISLDPMHRSCFLAWHGQREHGDGGSGGYSGGCGPSAGHRKEGILCEVSKPPFTPEVTSRKASCSLDDFLVVEMFINEGSYSTSDGQVESEDSAAFRPQEHHYSWSMRALSMFTSCIVVQLAFGHRHSVQSYSSALPNILYLESNPALRSEYNLWEREGLLCTPLSVTLNLIV